MNPYIETPPLNFEETYSTTELSALRGALVQTETTRQGTQEYHNETVITQSALNYLVFGASAAGGISAVFEANRDVVLALGAGATTAYGANSLFTSQGKVAVYGAANDSLRCVVNKGMLGLATADALMATTNGTDAAGKAKARLAMDLEAYDFSSVDLVQLASDIGKAIEVHDAMLLDIQAFTDLDTSYAANVTVHSDNILQVMNQRLRDSQPSAEAILRFGQGIGAGAISFANAAQAAAAPSALDKAAGGVDGQGNAALVDRLATNGEAKQPKPTEAQVADMKKHIKTIQDRAKAVKGLIVAAANAIDEIGTACVLKLPPLDALTLSTEEITLSKDETFNIKLTGGKRPFSIAWEGTPAPENVVSFSFSPGASHVTLSGNSELKPGGGGPYKLSITDSKAASETKTITIKLPAAES